MDTMKSTLLILGAFVFGLGIGVTVVAVTIDHLPIALAGGIQMIIGAALLWIIWRTKERK